MRKLFTLTMILILVSYYNVIPANAQQVTQAQQKAADKIKLKITKLGEKTRVIVILKDNRQLRGQIEKINDDNFDLVWGYSPVTTTFAYTEVKKVIDDSYIKKPPIGLIMLALIAGTIVGAIIHQTRKK